MSRITVEYIGDDTYVIEGPYTIIENFTTKANGEGLNIIEKAPRYKVKMLINKTFNEYYNDNKPKELTNKEINVILSMLPSVETVLDQNNRLIADQQKYILQQKLKNVKISPLAIKDLTETIIKHYRQAMVSIGYNIGLNAADALCAKVTQMLLKAYHAPGQKQSFSTLDLFEDIIGGRNNIMRSEARLYIKGYLTLKQLLEKSYSYTYLTVKSVLIDTKRIEMSRDKFPWWYHLFEIKNSITLLFDPSPLGIGVRLIFDREKLALYNISIISILEKITSANQTTRIVYSPDIILNDVRVIIFDIYTNLNSTNSQLQVLEDEIRNQLDILISKLPTIKLTGFKGISDCTYVQNPIWSTINSSKYKDGKVNIVLNLSTLTFSGFSDTEMLVFFKYFGNVTYEKIPHSSRILNYVIEHDVNKTQKLIDALILQYGERKIESKDSNSFDKQFNIIKQYTDHKYFNKSILKTSGSNLREIYNSDLTIDRSKSFSTNIVEMAGLYGINVAYNLITYLIYDLDEKMGGGSDYRHIEIFAKYLTWNGNVGSMNQSGMLKSEGNPWNVIAFEETAKNMSKQAFFGQQTQMNNAVTSIVTGLPAPIGPKYTKRQIDTSKFVKLSKESIEKQKQLAEKYKLIKLKK